MISCAEPWTFQSNKTMLNISHFNTISQQKRIKNVGQTFCDRITNIQLGYRQNIEVQISVTKAQLDTTAAARRRLVVVSSENFIQRLENVRQLRTFSVLGVSRTIFGRVSAVIGWEWADRSLDVTQIPRSATQSPSVIHYRPNCFF